MTSAIFFIRHYFSPRTAHHQWNEQYICTHQRKFLVLDLLFITQAYCWDDMGAYLTNVNDQNEQDFLTQLINMTLNEGN